MPLTWTTKPVALEWATAVPTDFETGELLAISHPYGDQWGTCLVRFPQARAQDTDQLDGVALFVRYDERTVFFGHVVEIPSDVGGGADNVEVLLADYRWYLNGRKVGMRGIGTADPTTGGFPVVGRRVHFNPDGRSNRAAQLEEDGEVYTFDSSATAVPWTAKDILAFLLHFYGTGVQYREADLPTGWEDEEPDFLCYGLSLPQALTKLTARLGQSWSLKYEGDTVLFAAIATPGTTTVTVTLPAASEPANASAATAWAARNVRVLRRITDSADHVEIHAAPTQTDLTLTNVASDTAAFHALDYFDPGPGWQAGYYMNDSRVTPEQRVALGLLPLANARRWVRELSTVAKDDLSDYEAARSAALLAGNGNRVYAEHCVWVQPSSEIEPSAVRRLKSGFRIDPAERVLLLAETLHFVDGGEVNSFVRSNDWNVWISIGVEWESTQVGYGPEIDPPLVDAERTMAMMIVRNDIVPRTRYKLLLPDLASEDVNAQVTFATDEAEVYVDPVPVMEAIYDKVGSSRDREVFVEVALLDIPDFVPGAQLAIAPAQLGLTGREVVTHYHATFGDQDMLVLYATTNLNRLPTGDA